MSWAEVKKAVNSDLSTPLNEQVLKWITKSPIKVHESSHTSSTNYISDSLTINSPCIIIAAAIMSYGTGSIIVDDNTIGNISGAYGYKEIILSSMMTYNVNNAAIANDNKFKINANYAANAFSLANANANDIPISVTTANTTQFIRFVTPLVCKSSLSMSVSSGGMSCIYTLI